MNKELNKIKSLLSADFWQLLKDCNAIIAGGAVTSVFCNREINDIDVYFRSERDLAQCLCAAYGIGNDIVSDTLSSYEVRVVGSTDKTVLCTNQDKSVQFIHFKYFENIQDIFNSFDFTICMGALDIRTEEFHLHPDFLQHNSQRYLKFNKNTDYPLISLMRVDKYREKGYYISKIELFKVAFAIMDLKIDSWECAKSHLGGMYGWDLNKTFDEEKEFSIDELLHQLDNLESSNIPLYFTQTESVDSKELLTKIFELDKVEMPNMGFDDEKYLYKCVTKDKLSPLAGNYTPIKYEVGSIIENNLIFFHKSSNEPYHQTDFWVECEVLSGEVLEGIYARKKELKNGSILVKRFFEYNGSDWEAKMKQKFPNLTNETEQ